MAKKRSKAATARQGASTKGSVVSTGDLKSRILLAIDREVGALALRPRFEDGSYSRPDGVGGTYTRPD